MIKKTGKQLATEMAFLLDCGYEPLTVLNHYIKSSNIPEDKFVENFHKHMGKTLIEWAEEVRSRPIQKIFEYGDEANAIITTLDSQPKLQRDKDLFIKNYNRKKLYELLNSLATQGMGYEPEIANDVSNHLVMQLIPELPAPTELPTNSTGAYTDVEVPSEQTEVCTDCAKLTDEPKTLPELTKFFELIARHFGELQKEIMDIYSGALDNLQSQGDWNAAAERCECQFASEDVKILIGGLTQPIMEEIAFSNRTLPEKDSIDAARLVFEWMKNQSKHVRVPLTEGFKIATDIETRYWKVRLDAIKEWESRLGTKSVEKAWKAFIKSKN
jgi:hypothetical protein